MESYLTALLQGAHITRADEGYYEGTVGGFPDVRTWGRDEKACRSKLRVLLQRDILRRLRIGDTLPYAGIIGPPTLEQPERSLARA
ncbi:MAG: hypothetical protein M3R24_36840 [Chloroflexota bacterium]|nr:hypothetical protein [Chloroflexota bacterium]